VNKKISLILPLMFFLFFYSGFADNRKQAQPALKEESLSIEEIFIKATKYFKNKKYDEAIVEFSKVIQINPNRAEAYYCRGFAYAQKRNPGQAIADYTKAIEINPDYAEV